MRGGRGTAHLYTCLLIYEGGGGSRTYILASPIYGGRGTARRWRGRPLLKFCLPLLAVARELDS